jgi:hypothetical protein
MNTAPDFSSLTSSLSLGPLISAVLSVGMIGLGFLVFVLGVLMVLDGLGYDPLDRFGDRKRDRRYRARYERETDSARYRQWKKEHNY